MCHCKCQLPFIDVQQGNCTGTHEKKVFTKLTIQHVTDFTRAGCQQTYCTALQLKPVIKHTDLSTATIQTTATYGLAVCNAPKMSSINKKITLVRLLKAWCEGGRRLFWHYQTNKIRVREE